MLFRSLLSLNDNDNNSLYTMPANNNNNNYKVAITSYILCIYVCK